MAQDKQRLSQPPVRPSSKEHLRWHKTSNVYPSHPSGRHPRNILDGTRQATSILATRQAVIQGTSQMAQDKQRLSQPPVRPSSKEHLRWHKTSNVYPSHPSGRHPRNILDGTRQATSILATRQAVIQGTSQMAQDKQRLSQPPVRPSSKEHLRWHKTSNVYPSHPSGRHPRNILDGTRQATSILATRQAVIQGTSQMTQDKQRLSQPPVRPSSKEHLRWHKTSNVYPSHPSGRHPRNILDGTRQATSILATRQAVIQGTSQMTQDKQRLSQPPVRPSSKEHLRWHKTSNVYPGHPSGRHPRNILDDTRQATSVLATRQAVIQGTSQMAQDKQRLSQPPVRPPSKEHLRWHKTSNVYPGHPSGRHPRNILDDTRQATSVLATRQAVIQGTSQMAQDKQRLSWPPVRPSSKEHLR